MRAAWQSIVVVLATAAGSAAHGQPAPATETPPPPPPSPEEPAYETVVVAPSPLHGSRLPRDRVPANVQTVTAAALAERRSLDLSAFMNDALGSVHMNDVQSNPLQPDIQYRGYLVSPLLGAPQGLAVYVDGVRMNEPFGDTINWDLLPPNAIRSVNLMPGSNPIFGLNTLGGALSIETKSGFSDSEAKDDTVMPYAPSAALVVTTVTPEANRPAACRKVWPESWIIPSRAPSGPETGRRAGARVLGWKDHVPRFGVRGRRA